MPLFRRYVLGMELSDTLFKLVELKKGFRRVQLKQYVVHPLLPVWMKEASLAEPEELIQSIGDALAGLHLHTRRVHLALGNRHVLTRRWRVPEMNRRRMKCWIRKKVLPQWELPFEDPLFDFQETGHVWQDGDWQEVVVAVTSRRYVEELTELVRWCGLDPVSVDLSARSLARWIDYTVSSTASRLVVLQLSKTGVELSVFHHGVIQGSAWISLPVSRFAEGPPERPSTDPLAPILVKEEEIAAYGEAMLEALKGEGIDGFGLELWRSPVEWVLCGEGVDMEALRRWMESRESLPVLTAPGPEGMMTESLRIHASKWLGSSLSVPAGAALTEVDSA